jgi:hypothetical protein
MKRHSYLRFLTLATAVLCTAIFSRPARAQDATPDPDDMKRGVARISLMNGDVSVRRGDDGEWVAGVINAPLLTGDRIATGANSRSEVQFDAANILRIGGNAEVRMAQLEAGTYRLELAKGTVTYRVLRPSDANVELATPSVSVRPSKEGTYRVTVNDAGETEITARAGDVEVFTPKGSQWVYAGQTMMARGNSSDPEFQVVSAIPLDDWDRWNESRDRTFLQSTSAQHVPQGVYGTEDMDSAGTWVDSPEYGSVWRPVVEVGWAPYRNGRWVYEPWYGWTWVSYDTWGWAPYHYGRWFFDAGFGWCWYPGGFGYRHYWSPALVGFFGWGHGVGAGFGFGFGRIGWVPLGPHEGFNRWWGRGGVAFNRNVNITNINVTNVYRNARVTGGVSGVSAEDFRGGRFTNIQRFSGNQIGQASLVHREMPAPGNGSRQFSNRTVANIPHSNENTHFFSRQGGSPVQSGRSIGQGTGAQGNVRPVAPAQNQSGFHRFGEPGAAGGNANAVNNRPAQSNPGNQGPANNNNNGPRRFGEPAGNPTAPRSNDRPPAAQRNGNWNTFGTPGSPAPQRAPYNPPPQRTAPTPNTTAPAGRSYSPPAYNNTPRSAPAPTYSAPRSAPSPSAPRSAPSSGGGNSRPSGGGSGGGHTGGRK